MLQLRYLRQRSLLSCCVMCIQVSYIFCIVPTKVGKQVIVLNSQFEKFCQKGYKAVKKWHNKVHKTTQ